MTCAVSATPILEIAATRRLFSCLLLGIHEEHYKRTEQYHHRYCFVYRHSTTSPHHERSADLS